jgi:hypothetical protein
MAALTTGDIDGGSDPVACMPAEHPVAKLNDVAR